MMGEIGTVTGIPPSSRFGILDVENGVVTSFLKKPGLEGLFDDGFFVLQKRVHRDRPWMIWGKG